MPHNLRDYCNTIYLFAKLSKTALFMLGAGEHFGRRKSVLSPCSRCQKGPGIWVQTRATASRKQRCREEGGASTRPLVEATRWVCKQGLGAEQRQRRKSRNTRQSASACSRERPAWWRRAVEKIPSQAFQRLFLLWIWRWWLLHSTSLRSTSLCETSLRSTSLRKTCRIHSTGLSKTSLFSATL